MIANTLHLNPPVVKLSGDRMSLPKGLKVPNTFPEYGLNRRFAHSIGLTFAVTGTQRQDAWAE